MLYSPEDYGQYVDPSTRRIWTIVDNSYLLAAYESGSLQQPDLVSWAARRNASTGFPLSASAASDVLTSASWSGAAEAWKILAASPGLLMLLAFCPLIVFSEFRWRRGRPALLQAAHDPQKLKQGFAVALPPPIPPLLFTGLTTIDCESGHSTAPAATLSGSYEHTAPPPMSPLELPQSRENDPELGLDVPPATVAEAGLEPQSLRSPQSPQSLRSVAVELKVDDRLQVLPGKKLDVGGTEFYKEGDVGSITETFTSDTGEERFAILWVRSGLISKCNKFSLLQNFQFITEQKDTHVRSVASLGSAAAEINVGDLWQALPGQSLIKGTAEYYKEGDLGTVTKNYTGGTGEERCAIIWDRTGLTSKCSKSLWHQSFQFVAADPNLGARLQVLPGQSFSSKGTEYYKEGDLGSITRSYTSGAGEERLAILWDRTGMISKCAKRQWFKSFQITKEAQGMLVTCAVAEAGLNTTLRSAAEDVELPAPGALSATILEANGPRLGARVQALPGQKFKDEGIEYYREGDMGSVTEGRMLIADGSGIDGDQIAVHWDRTGLICHCSRSLWPSSFQLVTGSHIGQSAATVPVSSKERWLTADINKIYRERNPDKLGEALRLLKTALRDGTEMKYYQNICEKYGATKCAEAVEINLKEVWQVLPGQELHARGTEYYKEGDVGSVTKMWMDGTGEERCAILWHRTGLTSKCNKNAWVTSFKFVSEAPVVGTKMQVLAGQHLDSKSTECYNEGDLGSVTKVYPSGSGEEKLCILWDRTGITTKTVKSQWFESFRIFRDVPAAASEQPPVPSPVPAHFSGAASAALADMAPAKFSATDFEASASPALSSTAPAGLSDSASAAAGGGATMAIAIAKAVELKKGARLQALPGKTLEAKGQEYYREGDFGSVSKFYTNNAGEERFCIMWDRTGLPSKHARSLWLENFQLVKGSHVSQSRIAVQDLPRTRAPEASLDGTLSSSGVFVSGLAQQPEGLHTAAVAGSQGSGLDLPLRSVGEMGSAMTLKQVGTAELDPLELPGAHSDVNRMSAKELHVEARARQKAMKRLSEVGHFDVLLRKEGQPLGLTFKLPETVCGQVRATTVQKALLKGVELTVPDGRELVNFGRYKGMPMRDVADSFPGFCESALLSEQESADPSIDLLRFVMFLRMARPEFRNEELEKMEEVRTHSAKEAMTLLVVDIMETSAADDYNRAQAAAGTWDRVILPGMHISAVNGIRRDALAMAAALCKSEVLTVRLLFLRESTNEQEEPLRINNDKMQRLLEERVSKLIRMEGQQIVDTMRTQADWEAMAASLASALVKEVYKGDRILQLPGIDQHMFNSNSNARPQSAPARSGVALPPIPAYQRSPSLPTGMPPEMAMLRSPGMMPLNSDSDRLGGINEDNGLSDSEESV